MQDVAVAISEKKPKVWVSMKVHDVTHLDISTQQFGAFFELDLKYEVDELFRSVPPSFFDLDSTAGPLAAASCKFPWIITNMVESDIVRENHFFKSADSREVGEQFRFEEGPPISMYGGCDRVSTSWSPPSGLQGTSCGRVFKCEQYVMRAVFKLYTVEYLWPFTGAWFMIKVATDERPGAEKLQLLPHHSDSSYAAFEAASLFGFVPVRRNAGPGLPTVPAVNYTIMRSSQMDESAGSYPKVYMVMAARRSNALEDWLKFYLMPFLSSMFVINYDFRDDDNFVSILATLILAYIALLFTLPPTSSLVFAEQNVLMNMVLLLISGYASYRHEVDHNIVSMMNCLVLTIVTVGQWLCARSTNCKVDTAIENSNWKAIASYL